MEEKKEVRSFVLHLKQINPSWEAKDIPGERILQRIRSDPSVGIRRNL
jgi:hypothetical protein